VIIIVIILTVFITAGITKAANNNGTQQEITPTPTEMIPNPEFANETGSIYLSNYLQASYKVITVLPNSSGKYDLVVMGARSTLKCGTAAAPFPCNDDTTCGTTLKAPVCYFYRQPRAVKGAEQPTKYIGMWKGGQDSLNLATLKFLNGDTVEFKSSGTDGIFTESATVTIDLANAKITESNRVSKGGAAHD
jgi:hypothetical protein